MTWTTLSSAGERLWIPQAARALATMAQNPESKPAIASIVGLGGTGKSTLLAHLQAVLQGSGVQVHRGVGAGLPIGRGSAYIIDDAHELTDGAVDRIVELMDAATSTVIVAYRPWPRSNALTRLAKYSGDQRVALGTYNHEELAELIRLVRPTNRISEILGATDGMPWLVHPLLALGGLDESTALTMPSTDIIGLSTVHARNTGAELDELLLALATGFDLSNTVPTSIPTDRLDLLIEQARASGVLRADGNLVPMVEEAILDATAVYRLRAMQRDLLDCAVACGIPLGSVAVKLARTGLRDARLSAALEDEADAVFATEPDRALELFSASIDAGADPRSTAARRAQAEVARGDLDAAGRILDDLLASNDPPDLSLAVETLAALWAQRGMLARSAATYGLLDAASAVDSAPLAAIALLGTGDIVGADAALDRSAPNGSSSLTAFAIDQLARGIRDSVDGTGDRALPALVRSSDALTSSQSARLLPDSPAALAAIVALQSGQLELAGSVIDDALRGGQCGPAACRRLQLLHGWTAMLADQTDEAAAVIHEVSNGGPLPARDEYLFVGLRVGLARRLDAGPELARAWHSAREIILHVPVDLYSLLPLGELVVAAARTRESPRVELQLSDSWALLERLGDPPLWSTMLHWSCVQAAILSNSPQALRPHSEALLRASSDSRLAALLSKAGRAWHSVLGGTVDVPQVEAASRGLAAAGLRWDGARLAGHAAGRTELRPDMIRLLALARDLRWNPDNQPDRHGIQGQTGNGRDGGNDQRLTAREVEVARLVLEGKTYREIGAAIFLSPRTAEHHMARVRRRLGATSRSELHDQLRDVLERPPQVDPTAVENP